MTRMMTTRIWMRSTSTSSNKGERGLFWFLIGAALVKSLWDVWWRWALPPRIPFRVSDANVILKSYYLKPIEEQMSNEINGLLNLVQSNANRQAYDELWHYTAPPLPKGWDRVKRYSRRKWNHYRPVIMTNHQKEELRDW